MTDVYFTVYPSLIFSKIIGLAPFSLNNEARKISLSKLGLLYSFIILVLYSGSSGYVLYEIMFVQRQENMHISEVNKVCQVACGAGVTVVTILLAIIQRNKLMAVINNMHQIDGEIKKLNIEIPFEKLRKFSIIQIISLIIFLILLTIHAALVSMDDNKIHGMWIVSLLPPIFNFIMEFQFITAALLLKKHFNLLNEYLSNFSGKTKGAFDVQKELTDTYMDGNETFLGPKLVDTAFIAWDGNFSRFKPKKEITSSLPEKQTQLGNIKIFRKIHSSLCDVKEFLNSAFSLQLLASVAQAFVLITSNLYLLFTTLSDSSSPSVPWLTYPIVWTITHAIELIFIVVTCTKTSKQANQTAVVVHKLLAKDCEPDLRNQFKLFSIQLLHRKISFSACGFFTLDMTLLQAIIGAATTYLVILIQFHNSYEKKAE